MIPFINTVFGFLKLGKIANSVFVPNLCLHRPGKVILMAKKGKSKNTKLLGKLIACTYFGLSVLCMVSALFLTPDPKEAPVVQEIVYRTSYYYSKAHLLGQRSHSYRIEAQDGSVYTLGTPKIADISLFEQNVRQGDRIMIGYEARLQNRSVKPICYLEGNGQVFLSYAGYCKYYAPWKSWVAAAGFFIISVPMLLFAFFSLEDLALRAFSARVKRKPPIK